MNIMPVFAVIEKADAVAVLRQIGIFMRAHLEFCRIPAGVCMRGALHRAELNFIGRLVGKHLHGECGFQNQMAFVPVDVRVKIDTRRIVIQPNFLRNCAVHKNLFDLDTCARTVCNRCNLRFVRKRPRFFFIIITDFPVVVITGIIFIGSHHVAPRARF